MNRERPQLRSTASLRDIIIKGLCSNSNCAGMQCGDCMYEDDDEVLSDEEVWEEVKELFKLGE